jgi:hypothetical protein
LCDEWTPAQVKAFRLLVNRSATWADWDDELLALELSDLKTMDFKLDLTGFDPQEIASCLAKQIWKSTALTEADEVPPVPADPGIAAWRCLDSGTPPCHVRRLHRDRLGRAFDSG